MNLAFSIDPATVVQLLVATVLPLLVGLVTRTVTASGVKAVLLAACSLATSVLTELGRVLAAGGAFDVGVSLLAALPTFLVAVGMHYGIWKPTGASAVAQLVGDRAADGGWIPDDGVALPGDTLGFVTGPHTRFVPGAGTGRSYGLPTEAADDGPHDLNRDAR